jgi:hypothetical protein
VWNKFTEHPAEKEEPTDTDAKGDTNASEKKESKKE